MILPILQAVIDLVSGRRQTLDAPLVAERDDRINPRGATAGYEARGKRNREQQNGSAPRAGEWPHTDLRATARSKDRRRALRPRHANGSPRTLETRFCRADPRLESRGRYISGFRSWPLPLENACSERPWPPRWRNANPLWRSCRYATPRPHPAPALSPGTTPPASRRTPEWGACRSTIEELRIGYSNQTSFGCSIRFAHTFRARSSATRMEDPTTTGVRPRAENSR